MSSHDTTSRSDGIRPLHSLTSTVLEQPPSCVECSRIEPGYFVVGTYSLELEDGIEDADENTKLGSEQSRSGSLLLYRLLGEDVLVFIFPMVFRIALCAQKLRVGPWLSTLLETVHCPSAVLDVHFSPHEPSLLAAALSTGSISFFTLDTLPIPHLDHQIISYPFPPSTLVLSLAWHPVYSSILSVTLSTGTVEILELFRNGITRLEILHRSLNDHGLENWTLAFGLPDRSLQGRHSPHYGHKLYSGGDDAVIRAIMFSSIASSEAGKTEQQKPIRRLHNAGVTALLVLPWRFAALEHDLLLTGSYDEYVRLIDPLSMTVLAEKNLGGGVWRLKFMKDYAAILGLESNGAGGYTLQPGNEAQSETTPTRLLVLASCMHVGSRILEIAKDLEHDWKMKVLAKFEEHESMSYGGDVLSSHETSPTGQTVFTCVSISFYDRLLCIWHFKDNLSTDAQPQVQRQ